MLQAREQIGRLDREIIILQEIITDGDSNEDKNIGWEEIDTDPVIPASKEETGGTEVDLAGRLTYQQPTAFVIRWRDDITVEMRVAYDQRVYAIAAIHEIGRRRYLKLATSLLDNQYWT